MRCQEKLRFISTTLAEASRPPVILKPCLAPPEDFENCCACSKCLQTILGLLAESADLRRYGFDVDAGIALRTLRTKIERHRLGFSDIGELLQ